MKKFTLILGVLLLSNIAYADVKLRFPLNEYKLGVQASLDRISGLSAYFDQDSVDGPDGLVYVLGISLKTKNFKCETGRMYDQHTGVDFNANIGDAVIAAAPGKVVQFENTCDAENGYFGNGCGGGLGNHVVLEHDVVTRIADRYFGGHFTV